MTRRGVQWERVFGGAAATAAILFALALADEVNHLVLAVGTNAIVAMVYGIVEAVSTSKEGPEAGSTSIKGER